MSDSRIIYKINKEKNPDSIIFDFKYFSKASGTDNFADGYDYTAYNFASGTTSSSVSKNATEVLTDYYGRPITIFGTLLDTTVEAVDATGLLSHRSD